MNALVRSNLKMLGSQLHRAGPYLLLELLLPGGTVFALLLFLYRNRPLRAQNHHAARAPVVTLRVTEGARRSALLPQGMASVAGSGTL